MTTLVEDLLLLARLDEGQPLKITDVDLTQLAIETVSDEKVMAPDRIWQLELPDEPVVVRGDATQLHQVLANLLSNARKHTEPGTKVVTGVMRSADGSAVVTVTDNGSGIAPEFVGRVFARFARADASRTNPAASPARRHAVRRPRRGSRLPAPPDARPPAVRPRPPRPPAHGDCRADVRGHQRAGPVHCPVDRGGPRRDRRGHVPARPDGVRRAAARGAAAGVPKAGRRAAQADTPPS